MGGEGCLHSARACMQPCRHAQPSRPSCRASCASCACVPTRCAPRACHCQGCRKPAQPSPALGRVPSACAACTASLLPCKQVAPGSVVPQRVGHARPAAGSAALLPQLPTAGQCRYVCMADGAAFRCRVGSHGLAHAACLTARWWAPSAGLRAHVWRRRRRVGRACQAGRSPLGRGAEGGGACLDLQCTATA